MKQSSPPISKTLVLPLDVPLPQRGDEIPIETLVGGIRCVLRVTSVGKPRHHGGEIHVSIKGVQVTEVTE